MSSYVDIFKTNNFQDLLKNVENSKEFEIKKDNSRTRKLTINKASNLEEKNKEIWSTEYILSIYKNISEI